MEIKEMSAGIKKAQNTTRYLAFSSFDRLFSVFFHKNLHRFCWSKGSFQTKSLPKTKKSTCQKITSGY
jgi:hypothetical protein